jgi:hypothetical protein
MTRAKRGYARRMIDVCIAGIAGPSVAGTFLANRRLRGIFGIVRGLDAVL